MECQYCKGYQSGKVRHNGTDEKKGATRLCRITNATVDARDKACDRFDAADRFWCNTDGNWLHATVCVARQRKRHPGCGTCRQGEIVKGIAPNRFQRRER